MCSSGFNTNDGNTDSKQALVSFVIADLAALAAETGIETLVP